MKKLHGSIVALITPWSDNKLNETQLQSLIKWHTETGTHGILVAGTTGEGFMLSPEEYRTLIQISANTLKEIEQPAVFLEEPQKLSYPLPLIAGVSGVATAEAVLQARHAEQAGAEALLILTPAYVKPSSDGLYHHFLSIHEACSLPLIVYNCPGRSSLDISLETLEKLATLPRIIGIKDSSGNLSRPAKIRNALGKDFIQLCGEDAVTLGYYAEGGHGSISVTANIAPYHCSNLYHSFLAQDFTQAGLFRDFLSPLHEALFFETNPGPVKFAASLLNLCSAELRSPLAPLSQLSQQRIKDIMEKTILPLLPEGKF